ncbi:peptidylprolyl isomerase [Sphingomonas aracearum]|uniref:Peptidyl-prolyl cis-trans isomerase n=1 Tax=Sphingomonas aracearum TaxID=2283317 RepID=A0A369VZF4_9SPHN|nr:peptidylprolyl isomerase [Sphingomonas aracearum]RDE06452.1 peptidylprolyl isomerase [Sphingomonas aracearum]
MRLIASLVAMTLATLTAPAGAQVINEQMNGRAAAPSQTDPENLVYLDLSDGGRVTIWLRPDVAPKMVTQFKTLVRQRFYDGLAFHRVIEGFMAQGGDPKGDGTGGSTLPNVPAEYNYLPHVRGAVAAARPSAGEGASQEQIDAAKNGANSQFFIMLMPNLTLDKKYTIFGRVIGGMPYVDQIERGEPPANPTKIVHAYVAADNPPAYAPPPPAAAPLTELPPSKPATQRGVAKPLLKKAPAKK